MILYVNGCSHTAAAEAAHPAAFAEDDGDLAYLGRRPHPLNISVSWGWHVAKALNSEFYCDAESAASNDRILRTTRAWVKQNQERLSRTLMIVQWTTWEREEWWHQVSQRYYQVNASGVDQVPPEWQQRYKQYIADVDWNIKTQQAHNNIWQLHCELQDLGVQHLFFSGHSTFSDIRNQHDWGRNYIHPYSRDHSYNAVLKNNGFEYVDPKGFHFGKDGHSFWANYVLQYLRQNNFLESFDEVPAY